MTADSYAQAQESAWLAAGRPSCRHCGESLAGRFERVSWSDRRDNLYRVFRCVCGKARIARVKATTG